MEEYKISLLTKTGAQAFENTSSQQRDKVEYLKLKSGESIKVAFLRDPDVSGIIASAEFLSHSDYPKVYSHPCISVQESCPSCEIGIKRSKRKIIAFLDLTDGKRKAFECSPKQYDAIKASISDYLEDGSVFELAFKLSKAGSGTATTVTVTPILKGMSVSEKEALTDNSEPVDVSFFDNAVGEPTADYIRQKIAGYTPAPKEEESDDPTRRF